MGTVETLSIMFDLFCLIIFVVILAIPFAGTYAVCAFLELETEACGCIRQSIIENSYVVRTTWQGRREE